MRATLFSLATLVAAAPGFLTAQEAIPPREEQIAAAVLALPDEMRPSARVLGYDASGALVTLREGKGMICLAQYPKEKQFHVSCYHASLEPFMARGRVLREGGAQPNQIDSVRFAEVKSGKLKVASGPAALYQLFGGTFDPKAGSVSGEKRLYVVYVPYATGAATGMPEKPRGSDPWIMHPGTVKAHIMFSPSM